MMQLPGGIARNGRLYRDFQFKPLTGEQQLQINDAIAKSESIVDCVTHVLACCLKTLAGKVPDVDTLTSLSVGDRQFLMRRLAISMDDQPIWLTANCHHCQEGFDLAYQQSVLPVKDANQDHPQRQLSCGCGDVWVRAISGADQRILSGMGDYQQARDVLFKRIVSYEEPAQSGAAASENADFDIALLSDADRDLIEHAVEQISPEVTDCLTANCPHCDSVNQIAIDPYRCLYHQNNHLIDEVHRIASQYHWSERDILAMPVARRERYLALIAKNNGEHHQAYASLGAS